MRIWRRPRRLLSHENEQSEHSPEVASIGVSATSQVKEVEVDSLRQRTQRPYDETAPNGSASLFDDDGISPYPPCLYCDLDGVLCDFEAAVANVFQTSFEDIDRKDMWRRLPSIRDFYSDLPWTVDGKELWTAIASLQPVILSGVPESWGRVARSQKIRWVRRELGDHVPICTSLKREKALACRRGDILIDDNLDAKEPWESRGGVFVHHHSSTTTVHELKRLGVLSSATSTLASGKYGCSRWVLTSWQNSWWWCRLVSGDDLDDTSDSPAQVVEFMEPPHSGYRWRTSSFRRPKAPAEHSRHKRIISARGNGNANSSNNTTTLRKRGRVWKDENGRASSNTFSSVGWQ
eukprot:TRINITY_DN46307_c0_g1_i1.p1 TRINITY_DN46307_c0_g1~~TRINITY_DN46307_c0_g1_i1.p1  ORF type:complete len:395 (-),score=39.13 TRINITY_DN46307_c0_g1_i1:187-1233(-)